MHAHRLARARNPPMAHARVSSSAGRPQELRASFSAALQRAELGPHWSHLTHALSGLSCASLNLLATPQFMAEWQSGPGGGGGGSASGEPPAELRCDERCAGHGAWGLAATARGAGRAGGHHRVCVRGGTVCAGQGGHASPEIAHPGLGIAFVDEPLRSEVQCTVHSTHSSRVPYPAVEAPASGATALSSRPAPATATCCCCCHRTAGTGTSPHPAAPRPPRPTPGTSTRRSRERRCARRT